MKKDKWRRLCEDWEKHLLARGKNVKGIKIEITQADIDRAIKRHIIESTD